MHVDASEPDLHESPSTSANHFDNTSLDRSWNPRYRTIYFVSPEIVGPTADCVLAPLLQHLPAKEDGALSPDTRLPTLSCES